MANRMTYKIGFEADTTQLKAALQETQKLLLDISANTKGFGLNSDMKLAAQSARELSTYLSNAFDANTGKLDLSKFQQSLKMGGTDLKTYADRLQAIGPAGEKAFLSIATAINKAELPIKRTNQLMDKLWVTMKNTVRWQITSSALNSFIGGLETAYGYAKDLDESLNNIRIVTSKSAEDMAIFAQEANKAAKALNTTTVKYSDASLIYFQQGDTDEEVRQKTETTIKMANVTGDDVQTVSEQLTAIWNNFDDGSRSLQSYADAMVALGAATASSSAEIAGGVQQFAAVAETVGMSYDYATTALATLTAETRQSENVVGTALRTLFTRIQGLQQDETQDDGTNLNKYSQALANVGINIKETSGELKGMDTILNEMGETWGTLSNAQQVALAQTVAGVRQYTQLVALMENWDTFQENLAIAQNSDGALEEQAQIYAESWRAARDNVRTSAEDIYDSLFDPQFFTDVTNGFADIVGVIADVVDGMGGLGGVALTTGSLLLNIYGDKFAQALRDAAYNIGVITGVQDSLNIGLKKQFASLAVMTTTDSASSSDSEMLRFEFQKKNMQLQIQLHEKAGQLTQEQYEQLNTEREQIAAIGEMVAQYAKFTEQTQQAADNQRDLITSTSTAFRNKDGGADVFNNVTSQLRGGVINQINKEFKNVFNDIDVSGFDKLVTLFGALNNKLGGLKSLKAQLDALAKSANNSEGETRELVTEYERLSKLYKELTGNTFKILPEGASVEDIKNAIASAEKGVKQIQGSTRNAIQEVQDGLIGDNFVQQDDQHIAVATDQLEQLADAENKAGEAATNLDAAEENASDQMDEFGEKLDGDIPKTKDWAAQIVAAGQGLMSLITVINSIKQLGSIWSNDDLTTGEKLTQTISSLATVMISVAPLISTSTKLIDADSMAKIKNLLATGQNAAGQITLGTAAKIGAIGVGSMAAAVWSLLWPLLAVAAAVAAVALVIAAATKAYNADADAAKRAAEASQELADNSSELKDELDSLKQAFDAYDTAVEKLENCVKGTKEWYEALAEVNQQVLDILENSPDLAAQIQTTRDENGILSITNKDEILDAAEQRATNAQYASIMGSTSAGAAQFKSSQTDLSRTIGSYIHGAGEYTTYYNAGKIMTDNWEQLSNAENDFETVLRDITENAKTVYGMTEVEYESMIDSLMSYQDEINLLADNANQLALQIENSANIIAEQELGTEYDATSKEIASEAYEQAYDDIYDDIIKKDADNNSKASSSTSTSEDIWRRFNEANGTNLIAAKNQIRGTDDDRTYWYKTDTGEDSYTIEYIAATIAAAEALEAMGKSAQEAAGIISGLSLEGKNFAAGIAESKNQLTGDYEMANYLQNFTAKQLEAIKAGLNIDDNIIETNVLDLFGVNIDEFNALADQFGMTGKELLQALLDGANEAAESLTDDQQKYVNFLGEAAQNMTIAQQKAFADAYKNALDNQNEYSGVAGLSTIAKENADNENLTAFLGELSAINFTAEDATEKVRALAEKYNISGTAVDNYIAKIDALEKTFSVSTGNIQAIKAALDEVVGENLEVGSIISPEDLEVLKNAGIDVDSYFTLMADGTYQLTRAADLFNDTVDNITIGALQDQLADYEAARQAMAEKYNYSQSYFLGDVEGSTSNDNDQALGKARLEYVQSFGDIDYSSMSAEDQAIANRLLTQDINDDLQLTQDQLRVINEMIMAINANEAQTEAQLFTTATTLAELESYVGQLGDYNYNSYAEGLLALAGQYENCASEVENFQNALINGNQDAIAAAEEQLKVSLKIAEAAEKYDLVAEEVEVQSKKLAKAYDLSADEATQLAINNQRLNKGVATLIDNWNDWKKALNSTDKTTTDYANTVIELTDVISDLVNAGDDLELPDDFFSTDKMALLEAAANGDSSAIDQLGAAVGNTQVEMLSFNQALADMVMASDLAANADLSLNTTQFETDKTLVLNGIQDLQTAIANGSIAAGGSIDSMGADWVAALNRMALATGMSVEDMNSLLGSLGVQAKVTTTYVPQQMEIPTYVDVVEPDTPVKIASGVDENGNTTYSEVQGYRRYSVPGKPVTVEGYAAVAQISTEDNPLTASIETQTWSGGGGSSRGSSPTFVGHGSVSPSVTNGNGGGGGSSEPKKLDKSEDKTWEDIEDRYHEINRELEDQASILEDIGNNIDRAYGTNKLALYEKQIEELNKQQDMYNAKLKIAENYLASDAAEIKDLLGLTDADFNEFGEIQDYDSILTSILDEYNAENALYNEFIDRYNAASTAAAQEAMEAELEAWKIRIEEAEANYEAKLAALAQYEETLDTIQEIRDSIEETAREIEDAKLDKIEHRLEVVIDMKEMRDAVRDLTKEIAESFGDALTHGIEVAQLDWASAQANMGLLSEYSQTFSEYQNALANATEATDIDRIIGNLKDLQGQVIGTAEALLEWIESIETMLPDAIDAAAERFALFTDQLEHNESVLDTIRELYALQGVTYKTANGFAQLQRVSQEQMEAQLAQAELQRAWFENARVALLEAEAALVGVSEDDAAYDTLKNNRDALLAEYNEAQEAMLSAAQSVMETAQQMYTDALEKTVYDFGQIVSNGQGLDLLQEKYDHYIETEERYLDKVNEAYQVASWYNKLQDDIDDTTNSVMKNRLQALQEEINSRREGNKLSQYDLDILEAKYNVLQAQIALEDAQNAKNELRLVRDSQGNWNYQYTADQSGIDDAQQNLLNAENEYYNIAKQQTEDVTGMIISAWQECEEKIKEIYSDMTLTDEERTAKAEELYAYYTEKIKYLEEEKQIAIQDMTAAGNEALFDMAVVLGDEITDLTGITSDDIQNIVAESGMSIIELLSADNETIKEIVGSNTELIDLFENTYAEDLSKMTTNTTEFETNLYNTLLKCETDFQSFKETVNTVATDTGTDLDTLKGYIDNVSDATDTAKEKGSDAIDEIWNELYKIQEVSEGYADLALSVYKYIDALRDLAAQLATTAGSEAGVGGSGANAAMGTGYDIGTDYSAMISQGIANGWITYGDDKYNTLFEQREAKIKGEGYEKEYFGTRGDEADAGFKAINKGDTIGGYAEGQYDTEEEWRKQWDKVSQFATGGYTGDFNDSKLAFLHEKELVLNQEDTRNILSAVAAVRTIGPEIFSAIERALDGNGIAALAMMASRLSGAETVSSTHDTIEQHVTIEHVEFPNVTSSDEIQDAFASIVNDASQWARRRKS